MSRRIANIIGAAVLSAAMLFGAAALSAQQAPQAAQSAQSAQQPTLVIAGTVVSVRSHTSGWVYVDARHGSNRVAGWYAPSQIEAWAMDAERVLTGAGMDGTPVARPASNAAAGARVEFKTPLLMSADTGAMVLDRVEGDVGVSHGLFLADKGVAHRMYLPMSATDARAFVDAIRGAALGSRQLAAAAKATAQPATTEKTRVGGM